MAVRDRFSKLRESKGWSVEGLVGDRLILEELANVFGIEAGCFSGIAPTPRAVADA